MTPLAIALIVLVAMLLLGLPIFMSLIISSVVAIQMCIRDSAEPVRRDAQEAWH